ncbi:phosphoribosylanthranilate isomerase [Metallosphaera cuprina]|uniref:N-(5'-phosphoribosyl)anthranilate isomerase n=1 Tax=Metallosphaera cuprina (strain Ar-4) TaxID=1006006 RepID=F4G0M8_METCR|nr:phosphoribosylanthranilate isomerase [Metallosphaera cuprina]AEB94647.1 phosphoribosylanthranilate isomerase TrpF-like protein [Metallosphaera cuprina Ar-4]
MTKLKVCGIATLDDAIELAKLNVHMLGFVTDPISPRYVKFDFLNFLKSLTLPLVSVNVFNIREAIRRTPSNFLIQVHRILNDDEMDIMTTYERKFIMYVPMSERYLPYLEKALNLTGMVLLDLERKSDKPDLNFASKVLKDHPEVGIGGGINLDNVREFLKLEPGWIDVSRGVEDFPGKKNLNKVRKLLEVIA